jgi:zinc protease
VTTSANNSPLIPFQRETLPNGTTLLIKENRSVPLAAVDLWVATGTANELPEEGGISHFLEHLFFKGTRNRPVGVMDREIKSLGGYNNAATSYDFTHYYVVLPAEHVNLALDILLDALMNMELPVEEIERERQVVLEEIARRDDNPLGKLYDDFLSKIFEGTPYQFPILGTAESLAGIDRDKFLDYRRRHYGANSLHIAVAGDVDAASVSTRVRELTDALPGTDATRGPEVNGNSLAAPLEFEIHKDVQQTYFLYGNRTPSIQGTPDEIALDLISTILGDGRSSRLVSRLVERTGLCSTATAFVWTLDRVGMFGVETCHPDENEDEVLSIVWEELDRIREEPIPDVELEKAKTLMLTSYAFSLEKTSSMAGVLGRNSANGQLDAVLTYPQRVKAMTAEKAREAFNRCCPKGLHAIGFVRPEKKS